MNASATPDTIAAVASPAGRGAVAVVRLSGPAVPHIAQRVLGTLPAPRRAVYAPFRDADGSAIDVGLALYFPAPASFTGEHVLELQGHGGILIADRVLQRVLSLGARMAHPGEFSERAFLNGKMDLAQAEAVADLIDAGTAAAARAAVRSMQGEFSTRIRGLQAMLTELRVYVEAAIDFPDEEVDFLSGDGFRDRLTRLRASFDDITAAARQGAVLREGLHVVIAGKPNAGKSSLLNRLVGNEVAIVTDLPGTTRDVLRHTIDLDGLPINLIDTAGLRRAADVVEAEGIRRARTEMERADHVLFVIDAAAGAPEVNAARDALREIARTVPATLVFNKIDAAGAITASEAGDEAILRISALTGAGMTQLRDHLKSVAGYRSGDAGLVSARRRHLDALKLARAAVESADVALRDTVAVELFAEDLRLAQRNLSVITGELTSEDLLGEIFGSFCIGK